MSLGIGCRKGELAFRSGCLSTRVLTDFVSSCSFTLSSLAQDAIKAGEAISTKDCTVRIKLLAPPLYVLTTQTINRKEGIEMLSKAIDEVKSTIEGNKGKLVVREGARAVSERDEKLLREQMARLEGQNKDVAGDSDEDDYEEGMGDIDVENATPALQM